jgi:hypothetical protein
MNSWTKTTDMCQNFNEHASGIASVVVIKALRKPWEVGYNRRECVEKRRAAKQQMVQITLHNADTVDLFVSAIDNQQPGSPTVFPNQRINQGQSSAPFSVQEDGQGNFSITSTATDANDQTRTKTEVKTGSAGDQVDVTCS